MDIEEVLRYNPPTNNFSTNNENDDNDNTDSNDPQPSTSKRQRLNVSKNNNQDEIQKLLSEAPTNGDEHVNEIDSEQLKRLLLQLERRLLKNQEMRIKHMDDPSKFMDSECELFEIIKDLHIITTQPSLYDIAIQMNLPSHLLGLLSHENTDIACAVVALIQELTDLDDVDESEQFGRLIDALIDGQIIISLVSNMERLDENVREESECIYNSLAIIENLTDYQPELSKDIKPLILWLLRKLKSKTPSIFSANKLYASEILSILLQNSVDNRKLIGTLNGIDILLHVISYYKRHDPSTADEEEYVENLYDCLCCSLFMSNRNLELFIDAEGIELMVLILKEKRKKDSITDVRVGALKLLSHCFSHVDDKSDDGNNEIAATSSSKLITKLCDKFIEILGLRVLMPIFLRPTSIMGHGNRRRRKQTGQIIDQIEEYTLTIIAALLKHTSRPELRDRILNKFIEQNFMKTERLIELHLKYWERLNEFDNNNTSEIDDPDEKFIKRLNEGGLFILQLIDQIILMISLNRWESSSTSSSSSTTNNISFENLIKKQLKQLLNMHSNFKRNINHIEIIKTIVNEFLKEKLNGEQTNAKDMNDDDNYLLRCIETF